MAGGPGVPERDPPGGGAARPAAGLDGELRAARPAHSHRARRVRAAAGRDERQELLIDTDDCNFCKGPIP